MQQSSSAPIGANIALQQLLELREEMLEERVPEGIDPHFSASALNLLHYLVMRRRDLRPLQDQLSILGLSSLGRAESHVLATVEAVIFALEKRIGIDTAQEPEPRDFTIGQALLESHTDRLFGEPPKDRTGRIMVTMPSSAAHDYPLVHDLLQSGMNCMRINCAHDHAEDWKRMVEHLRRAEDALKRPCRVAMDLGGPKIRTGAIEPSAAVIKVRPERDAYGVVVRPARIWLSDEAPAPSPAQAELPVDALWLASLKPGMEIRFTDARNADRIMTVVHLDRHGAWAELERTAYFVPTTELRTEDGETLLHGLPATEAALLLQPGERLLVSLRHEMGVPALRDRSGDVLTPARISCILPEAFSEARPGDPIWFDDGKIGGIIETVGEGEIAVMITQTRSGGGKLRADKGINLPETDIRLTALTEKDLRDLEFVAEHAEIIQLSFANTAEDVRLLQAKLSPRTPAIVLKIETRRAFENLPAMLLQAMRWPVCGVMIARGDLAVECGFERLAEVQEEILWICEAAHVPVIWATQVLESLAKEGMASRSEVTDAAMAHRAECVMLNKGAHMITAVRFLGDVMRRMEAHQAKKKSRLRALQLAKMPS